MRGKIDWDDNIEMTCALPPDKIETNQSMPNFEDRFDPLESDMLECPKCNEVEPSYNFSLQGENIDA